MLTVALGVAFIVSKFGEWYLEIRSGHTFETNDFFAFYFFLTAIHVVHVFVGFIFMAVGHLRPARYGAGQLVAGDRLGVLAHGRLPVGRDLCPAVRGEVNMGHAVEVRLFGVWLALSAITLLSWWLGSEHGAQSAAITYGALSLVAIKVRVIVLEYMEARRSSKKLQRLMDAWLFVLLATLSVIYALKLGMPPV